MYAIIPARSGSKGLKNKNFKILKGKPLIFYTIEFALKSKRFSKIIISTDNKKIKKICYKKFSTQRDKIIFHSRKKKLSQDSSKIKDLILDIFKSFEYQDFVIFQPTSPLRKIKDLEKMLEIFYEKKANSVISVMKSKPISWLIEAPKKKKKLIFNKRMQTNRQENKKKYFFFNGSIYIFNYKFFLKSKNYLSDKSFIYVMDNIQSLDIDNSEDFKIVKAILHYKHKS